MMKLIKAAVLTTMIIAVSGVTAFSREDIWTEKEKADYAKNTEFLENLGVIDRDMDITDTITRGQFARMIVSMITDAAVGGDKDGYGFTDVNADTKYAEYIKTANVLGIVSGDENGMYRPSEDILTEEMIAGILKTMGYSAAAQRSGGYPDGYIYEADRIGLLYGTDIRIGYRITGGEALKLIMNALGVNFMPIYDGKNEIRSGEYNGFVEHLGVFKARGTVRTTHRGNIINDELLTDGYIRIDDEIYRDDADHSEYLGYMVDYFVDAEQGSILAMGKAYGKNEETVINSEDITEYVGRCYTYETDGRRKTQKVPYDAYILYNGSSTPYNDSEMMVPKNGGVKLLDNDADGNIDIVFITDYALCVVRSVNIDDLIVYDMFGSSRSVSIVNEEKCVIKRVSGERISISDLKKYDVLSVKQTYNKSFTEIIVCDDSFRGRVSSMDDDGYVAVAGVQYKIAGSGFYGDVKAGMSGLFLLDHTGKLAAFLDNSASEMNIGYVYRGIYSSETDEPELWLKILTSEGECIKLKTAEKVTIDKVRRTVSEVYDELKKGTDSFMPQVIMYDINEDNEIFVIDTPYNNGSEYAENIYAAIPLKGESWKSLRLLLPRDKRYYRSAQMTFDGKINISPATVIFSVSGNSENADDDEFTVVTKNALQGDRIYDTQMYSVGENKLVADVLVISETAATTIYKYGIVTQSGSVVNENNDVVTEVKITAYDRVYNAYMDKDDTVSGVINGSKIPEGSFIRFTLIADGKIKNAEVLYNGETGEMQANPTVELYAAEHRLILANVYDKENDVIAVTVKDTDGEITPDDLENHNAGQFKCYMYDRREKQNALRSITADDIADYEHAGRDCSKVLIYTYLAEARMLIVYAK